VGKTFAGKKVSPGEDKEKQSKTWRKCKHSVEDKKGKDVEKTGEDKKERAGGD